MSATPDVAERHPRAAAAVGAVEGNWLIKAMLLAGAAFGLALSVAQVAGLLG